MRAVILAVIAVAVLAIAAYAHGHLRPHVRGGAVRLVLLRLFLIGTGALFGTAAADAYGTAGIHYALIWLIGFGLVHVPAAAILFIKGERAKSP